MNRRSLSYELATVLRIEVASAQEIIHVFFEGITLGLSRGEQVRISGFGVFESWMRSPHSRMAYDIYRRKPLRPIELEEQIVVRFTPE